MQETIRSIENIIGSLLAGGIVTMLLSWLAHKFFENIEKKLEDLKKTDNDQWDEINNTKEKLNILQGEHNAKSCKK